MGFPHRTHGTDVGLSSGEEGLDVMVVLAVLSKWTLLLLRDGTTLDSGKRRAVPGCHTHHASSSQRRLDCVSFCMSCPDRIPKRLYEREGEDEPELPRFFASTGSTYQGVMNTNENILWFDSDIVGFLELLNDIEWLFRFLVPFA